MINMNECLSQCDCFNVNWIDSFKSIENHGSHVLINFDLDANLNDCVSCCEENCCDTSGCCADLSCSIVDTKHEKSIRIETSQTNGTEAGDIKISSLLLKNCCNPKS